MLDVPAAQPEAENTSWADANEPKPLSHPCPCCGGRMIIIETFQRGSSPRYRPVSFARGIPVWMMGINGTWRRDCVMLDISQTGARLRIEGSLQGLLASVVDGPRLSPP